MSTEKKTTTTFFYWFAWVLSLAASVVFLTFEVREWIVNSFAGKADASLIFIVLLMTAIVGSIVAIFRKITGGWLMLAGGTGLVIFFGLHGGIKVFGMMVVYGLPFVIPGIFFVLIRK